MLLRFLIWLNRRLERLGYACLNASKRVQTVALNEIAKQPSLPDGTRRHDEMDTSGSPATGESGGRRWLRRTARTEPFVEGGLLVWPIDFTPVTDPTFFTD